MYFPATVRAGALPNAALIHCLAETWSIPPALRLKTRISFIGATETSENDCAEFKNIPFIVGKGALHRVLEDLVVVSIVRMASREEGERRISAWLFCSE
jgi:hypothetical protein